MKKGIIFDMDGTLWDSSENVAKSWDEMVKKSGYKSKTVTRRDIQNVMGKTMDVIADILFDYTKKGAERDNLRKLCEEYEVAYLREHGGILYENVIETFEELKALGYNLYIVSNCQAGYIEAFLDFYNIEYGHEDALIEDIECYGNNLLSKDKNIELIVRRNNLDKAVYVGDTQGDFEATCNAGLPFIHAKYGFGSLGCVVPSIESFDTLPKIIDKVI